MLASSTANKFLFWIFPPLKLVSDSSENSASLKNYWQFWMLEKTLLPTPGFSIAM